MLEDRNNTMIFLWEIYSIFMQISSIVLVLQHGRRAHTLFVNNILLQIEANPVQMRLFFSGLGELETGPFTALLGYWIGSYIY